MVRRKRSSGGFLNGDFTYYALLSLITAQTGLSYYISLARTEEIGLTSTAIDAIRWTFQFASFSLAMNYAKWFVLPSIEDRLSYNTRSIMDLAPDDGQFADKFLRYLD